MTVVYADGADQNVDPTLLQAVEEAAADLGVTLYVSSTTGGTHSPQSAHWVDPEKGWGHAIDVSRINGRKMAALTPAKGGQVAMAIMSHIPFHRWRECINPQFANRFHRPVWPKSTSERLMGQHRDHCHISIVPLSDG